MCVGTHSTQVLTADTPGLLAVTDDVDACVVTVELPPPPAAAGLDGPPPPVEGRAQHAQTIPALAYVAAGKTQRKHLLLGEQPCPTMMVWCQAAAAVTLTGARTCDGRACAGWPAGGGAAACSAVLVEGTKFFYVYGPVRGKPEHGEQQVVDLQLEGQERVLGARLMRGAPWAAGGQGGRPQALLVVLTQFRLLAFVLG